MPLKDNVVVIVDGKVYDSQEIIRQIKAKYGEYPIISQSTKDMIADNVARMNRGTIKIDPKIIEELGLK